MTPAVVIAPAIVASVGNGTSVLSPTPTPALSAACLQVESAVKVARLNGSVAAMPSGAQPFFRQKKRNPALKCGMSGAVGRFIVATCAPVASSRSAIAVNAAWNAVESVSSVVSPRVAAPRASLANASNVTKVGCTRSAMSIGFTPPVMNWASLSVSVGPNGIAVRSSTCWIRMPGILTLVITGETEAALRT